MKSRRFNLNGVTAGTLARTLVLVLALINQLLDCFGRSPLPFTDEQVTTLVSAVWTAAAALAAYWKNNSLTAAAQEADNVLAVLKNGEEVVQDEFSEVE